MSDEMPNPVPAKFYQRSAFRAWWQSVTGFLASGLTGVMPWQSVWIACGVATLTASGAILFGETPGVAP